MVKVKYLFLIFVCISGLNLLAQNIERGQYRIMFYNVENLFDTIDTPNKNDEEFLPNGDKNWDSYRYWRKVKKTFQVVAAAGEGSPPDIIGFCEIESFWPLYNLTNNTPLAKYPYTIIHQDSPDRRGIDVALMFRSDKAELIKKEFLEVVFPWDTAAKTREILHASLQIERDTLHVFVNHWPSRRGGQFKSEPRRMLASSILIDAIDSVKSINSNAKIVVIGDFNDEPQNKSIKQLEEKAEMLNLSSSLQENCKCGTYRYKSEWNMLDQVFISKSFLNNERLYTSVESLRIFNSEFLLTDDPNYGGKKPYRTYLGPRYIGGYSDHLPVTLDLEYEIE